MKIECSHPQWSKYLHYCISSLIALLILRFNETTIKKIVNAKEKGSYHAFLAYVASYRCIHNRAQKENGACLVDHRDRIIGLSYAGYPGGIQNKIDQSTISYTTNMFLTFHFCYIIYF